MALTTTPETPAAVRTISRLLGEWIGRLGPVWVEGQVTEYRPRGGARFQYFVLRDTDVDMSLPVKADVGVLGRLEQPLAEGQRVIVHARPDFYAVRGSLSLLAKEIRPVGIGALLAELARLRDLLAAEGLFAPERKRPLPFLPRRIGLICGRNSAAMRDVFVNTRERWPGVEFDTREVAVQGPTAVAAVTSALQALDAEPVVDVIVIARGGGSVEDLLPFSNETLVRAVAACTTPVVSAIGHEQDAPLIDFVADLRASTPTDAAKRIVPSLVEQEEILARLRQRATMVLRHHLDREATGLGHRRQHARAVVAARLSAAATDLDHLRARVRALSPAATLERGYAIVLADDGSIVRDSAQVAPGGGLDIRLACGRIRAIRTVTAEN